MMGVTVGVVDIRARVALHTHALKVFGVVKEIMEDTTRFDAHEAAQSLSVLENDGASESSGLTWEIWQRLSSEHAPLINDSDHEVVFMRGMCGHQVHHWLEVKSKGMRYVIDVAPADIYSGPMLIGSRSPMTLMYG